MQLNSWRDFIESEVRKSYFKPIAQTMKRDKEILCPAYEDVFNVFKLVKPNQIKIVIIGQDPYINDEAHGLSFSSVDGMTPSLRIVFRELQESLGITRTNPNLTDWAEQGVFLLNRSLTTIRRNSNFHRNCGWHTFTGNTISFIEQNCNQPIVYMLWGNDAQTARNLVRNPNRLLLTAVHPVAQVYRPANKFVGCDHFKLANEYLGKHNITSINF